jgi:acetyl-CoA acetyltransferase
MSNAKIANKYSLRPLAKIISFEDAATDPIDFPIAPVLVIPKVFLIKKIFLIFLKLVTFFCFFKT